MDREREYFLMAQFTLMSLQIYPAELKETFVCLVSKSQTRMDSNYTHKHARSLAQIHLQIYIHHSLIYEYI